MVRHLRKFGLLIGLAWMVLPASAVTIMPTSDPATLSNALLIGAEITRIEGYGQIGVFRDLHIRGAGGTKQVLPSGVVLSTGLLADLPARNTMTYYGTATGSPGEELIQTQARDGDDGPQDSAAIRIRFDAPPGVNGVVARFVFASEEFPEFAGTKFADGFAFARAEMVSGVRRDVNYAIAANGEPVSLHGNSAALHFMSNESATMQIVDLEFDGITRILEVRAPVTAGAREEFTFVVADTGDGIYDSAVFLSALTFFNRPGYDFHRGTVKVEENPLFREQPPEPAPTSLFLLGNAIVGISLYTRQRSARQSRREAARR